MPHRPLSTWVTAVPLTGAGTARWEPGEVNFGDERSDARTLPEFNSGWDRRAVALDLGYSALGLVRAASAVVELDSLAMPVRVSGNGADVIARIEDQWPAAPVSAAAAGVLAAEGIAVRHLLLARLAAEGQPAPALFHILPWDLVERLAEDVTAMAGGAEPQPVIELGHWFTSAGSRFTAALEQLDEGLRSGDAVMARVAATALCDRLRTVDAARLPAATRRALARLVTTLPERDRFLRFAAMQAAQRLEDDSTSNAQLTPVRLDTLLPAAADSTTGIRTESRQAQREPFTLRLTVMATGRVQISIQAPVTPDPSAWLAKAYGVMLQPVTIADAAGTARYLIPLRYSEGEVSGRISIAVPRGRFVEADIDGPPIGAAEARHLSATEAERSIRGLRTRAARMPWVQLAALLPPAHPLRALIEKETP